MKYSLEKDYPENIKYISVLNINGLVSRKIQITNPFFWLLLTNMKNSVRMTLLRLIVASDFILTKIQPT